MSWLFFLNNSLNHDVAPVKETINTPDNPSGNGKQDRIKQRRALSSVREGTKFQLIVLSGQCVNMTWLRVHVEVWGVRRGNVAVAVSIEYYEILQQTPFEHKSLHLC